MVTPPPEPPPASRLPGFVQREFTFLLALSVVAVAAFLITRAAEHRNRQQQVADAAAWYERGHARLAAGRPADAVLAYRRAAARQPDDWRYGKALVQALRADGQTAAARQLLLLWRSQHPDDGDINAQLARLEAGAGEAAAAIEYYERAAYGRWAGDDSGQTRQALRQELIAFLLAQGQRGPALSQVLVLSANQPDDSASHLRTARLFLDVGEPARALDAFRRAMVLEPANEEARAGAADAAFALGDYARTLAYLRNASTPRAREMEATANAVLARDPLRRGLSTRDRWRRLSAAVADAERRLEACRAGHPPGSAGSSTITDATRGLFEYRRTLPPRAARVPADDIELGIALVATAIQAAVEHCPPRTEQDDILLRVASLHEGRE